MLKSIKIKNIAIIDECTIEFGHGFNVLSGETGAGKSIVIDSLEFVLGARADKTLIKSGTDMAHVVAVFDLGDVSDRDGICNILSVDKDDLLTISRTMTVQGKNECRINGELTSLATLKKITHKLVDIFGQHDSVALLDCSNHLAMLDSFDYERTDVLLDELNVLLNKIKDIDANINSLGGLGEQRERNIDILKYQIDEILAENLSEKEEQDLESKLNKLTNSEKVVQSLDTILSLLDGDYNISSAIKQSITNLDTLEQYDSSYADYAQRLNSVRYELEDIVSALDGERRDVEYSEDEINAIIDRLERIKDLKRKYGKTIIDVLEYLSDAQNKLDNLLNAEQRIKELNNQRDGLITDVSKVANELTTVRKTMAKELETKVVQGLRTLGMKNAQFEIYFEDYDINSIMEYVTPTGADKIEFMFSANLGVPVAPLSRIISGGEMSRFMLALKCVVGGDNKTFIFDEIDTGIGGDVGTIVAKKLYEIARNAQVLCITHLPQIACFGDINFLIKKQEISVTYTSVHKLTEAEKIDEITRMIGSVDSKEFAYKHAQELVKEANAYKLNN